MAKLLAMYKHPADTQAFDRYYFGTHVPLAKKMPGLARYDVNAGPVMTPAGPAGYYLVAILQFASMAALQSALGSAEGKATAADLANFAQAGVDLLLFDEKQA
jgi:uncharacterized protein (TIGR02118 family)